MCTTVVLLNIIENVYYFSLICIFWFNIEPDQILILHYANRNDIGVIARYINFLMWGSFSSRFSKLFDILRLLAAFNFKNHHLVHQRPWGCGVMECILFTVVD